MEKHDDIDALTLIVAPISIATVRVSASPVPAVANYSAGFKVGDTVKIFRDLQNISHSWPLVFTRDMHSMVGKTGVIIGVNQDGCDIITPATGILNTYPDFCLEMIGGAYPHKPEKTTTTDYTTKHEHCGFKIGDRVLIKRAPKDSDPKGFTIWENWQSNKLYSHGRIVDSLPSGFVVRFSDYDNEDSEDQGIFPYFVLQKF